LDNGDLMIMIRSPDGMREARFIAARGEHERNRQDVRPEGALRHLKL
jgi:hypothetical protein